MENDQIDVSRVAEEFSLEGDYTTARNVALKGKSGAQHKFDLVVTSTRDSNLRIAVLNSISDDLVNDLMRFNAMSMDCGIQIKALLVNKDLDETETNLARIYNIVMIDQRAKTGSKKGIFGVSELDDAVSGVMRKGNVYMISGKTGVGKTTSCTEFLVQGAKIGQKGAIILTDTRGSEYIANARSFTFGFNEYYQDGSIEVIELSDRIRELKEDVMESLKNWSRYITKLTNEIKKIIIESNIQRLAIDPITPMIVENDDFINQFIMSLAISNIYVLITSGIRKSDVSMFGIEEYFVSGIIKIDMEDMPGGVRRASIVKMRGGSYKTEPVYFKITSDGIVPATPHKEGVIPSSSVFRRVVV